MNTITSDVIVVGAGLAGAAAAARLARAGKTVTMLEGRNRVGGRAYLRHFGGDAHAPALEFGGAWITPWHSRIRAHVVELGLQLRPRHPVTERLWLRDGVVHGDGAASAENRLAHERTIARVAADSILLRKGFGENEKGDALRGISFADYLDRLGAPKATRDVFTAWWTVSGNGDHKQVAASEFLHSCAYDNGLAEGMINFWTDTVVPGMAALADGLIAQSGAARLLSQPVTHVERNPSGVQVTAAGKMHSARACVLALGINQLQTIHFTPMLSSAKRDAIATGHGGRSFKLWIRAEGVSTGTLVTGDGSGIEFAFAERQLDDGAVMIAGFGLMNEKSRPGDAAWARAETARLFPNARMIAHDWHDWIDDPFARGTWVAALAGHEAGLDPANWLPEGPIAFASSDYARDQAGWFEGAVIAGEDAADAVLKLI